MLTALLVHAFLWAALAAALLRCPGVACLLALSAVSTIVLDVY